MALSYNGFQVLNSKSISEFFAFSANISIFSILILVILLRSFGKYIAIIVFFIKFTIGRSYDDIILPTENYPFPDNTDAQYASSSVSYTNQINAFFFGMLDASSGCVWK